MLRPVDYAAAGIGLQYGTVRLVRTKETWTSIAEQIAEPLRSALGGVACGVEHVGSTAVPGLLAKPILDFAIGLQPGLAVDADAITTPMSQLGWIYRGDAGVDGGLVFVLEDTPWCRVAHAHGVEHGGDEWQRYLQFRDLLRESAGACRAYEHTKQRLAAEFPNEREQYTVGKTGTVRRLLLDGE